MFKSIVLLAILSVLSYNYSLSQNNEAYEFLYELTGYVNSDSLSQTIQDLESFVSRYSTNPNRTNIVSYLKNRFELYGCEIEVDTFYYENNGLTYEQYNLIGKIYGINDDPPILIGAHYDSCCRSDSSPGADDNASGISAVIEAARIISQSGFMPRRNIYFGAWAAEEQGLLGSKHYARKISQIGVELGLAINLDMIATNRSENYKANIEMSSSVAEQALFYANFNGNLSLIQNAQTGNSDHASFRQFGYPILYFYEFDFSQHYHTPRDLFIYLDMDYCARVTKAALANLFAFSQMLPTPEFICIGNSGTGSGIYAQWKPVKDAHSYRIKLSNNGDVMLDTIVTDCLDFRYEGLSLSYVRFYCAAIDSLMFEGKAYTKNIQLSDVPLALNEPMANSQNNKITISWETPSERDLKEITVWVRDEYQTEFADIGHTNPYTTEYTIYPEDSRHVFIKLQCVDSAGNIGLASKIIAGALTKFDRGLLVISDATANTCGFTGDSVKNYFKALDKIIPTTVIKASAEIPNIYGAYQMVLWHSTKAALSQKIVSNLRNLTNYLSIGGGLIISSDFPQKMIRVDEENTLSVPYESPVSSFMHVSQTEHILGSYLEQARSDCAPTLCVDSGKVSVSLSGNIKDFCSITPKVPLAPLYSAFTSSTHNLMNNKTIGIKSNETPKLCVLSFPLFFFKLDNVCSFFSFLKNEWGIVSIPVAENDKNDFEFYPNPVEDMLTLLIKKTDENVKIEIFDLHGIKLVSLHKKWYELLSSNKIRINLSGFKSGIYLIVINNRAKLIIKR